MNLANYIAQAREDHGLTLRQLESKAGDLDHAYIWRLEKGNKTKPSLEALNKLSTALKLNTREKSILVLLAKQEVDDSLYELMKNENIDWSLLESAATMSFRGQRPHSEKDWMKIIEFLDDL